MRTLKIRRAIAADSVGAIPSLARQKVKLYAFWGPTAIVFFCSRRAVTVCLLWHGGAASPRYVVIEGQALQLGAVGSDDIAFCRLSPCGKQPVFTC